MKIEKAIGIPAAVSASLGGLMQVAGLYSIINATTGAAMLGSTAAGASGAGTIGIIAGTSGLIGTAGAIVMAPVTIGVCSAVTIGAIGAHVWRKRKQPQG